MLALIPQSGDFSGAALGVRSVALLQVAKLAGECSAGKAPHDAGVIGDPAIAEVATILLACGRNLNYLN